MMEAIVELVTQFGPTMGILIFFIAWSYIREKAITQRLNENEDFVKTSLVEMVAETRAVVTDNSAALRESKEALQENTRAFEKVCNVMDETKLYLRDLRGATPTTQNLPKITHTDA